MPPLVDDILRALGYEKRGFLTKSGLSTVRRHRHALVDAFRSLDLVGVFGLTGNDESIGQSDFVPLVYVATAATSARAREIHLSAWSQGLVPFLIIVGERKIWSCNALAYPDRDGSSVIEIDAAEIAGDTLPRELLHLNARMLRTSLAWREREFAFESRIDLRLLRNLNELVRDVTRGVGSVPPLPSTLANALIGRFLYVRFLRDRDVLPRDWLPVLGVGKVSLADMWKSFEMVDDVFNGSIFPIPHKSRRQVTVQHLELLSDVLLREVDVTRSGYQLTFRDFRFKTLRTETLSAVYELFLADVRHAEGAFYTPPFLVDYVLNKVDSHSAFHARTTVFDCAAGSGAFLVGSFRRVVESALDRVGSQTLPLRRLRSILVSSIWGIERNADACHVAAFGLYLTMLDYLSRTALSDAIERGEKIFPSLVGTNILCRDFFDRSSMPEAVPRRFDVVVANPPWQTVEQNGESAKAYQHGPRGAQLDRGRVAAAFFWKSLDEHLKANGRFGFVMSGRALVSSAADRFPTALMAETGVSYIANLSHMRRKLFPDADHPAVVIVGDREPADEFVTIFSPLLTSQPVARDGTPWTIVEDRAVCEVFRRNRLSKLHAFVDALNLHPIDRRILQWLRDACESGRATTLDEVLATHNLDIKRGGFEPETGIPSEYTLGADYARKLAQASQPFDSEMEPYSLPQHVLARARAGYREIFSGNIVALPRKMSDIAFVTTPFAFNSSLNAIFSREPSPARTSVLQAIAIYLNSRFARYCLMLVGRDWAIDQRRLEQKELRQLPVPRELFDAESALEFFARVSYGDESAIHRSLGLSRNFVRSIEEFSDFRQGFQNGRVPPGARDRPEPSTVAAYKEVLGDELCSFVGANDRFRVDVSTDESHSLGFVIATKADGAPRSEQNDFERLADTFGRRGVDVFHDSSFVTFDRQRSHFAAVKPLSRSHWTVDRAIADAQRMVAQAIAPHPRSR